MTPTAKLRFVQRKVPMHPFYKTTDAQGNLVQAMQTYHVLQQWWANDPDCHEDFVLKVNGEWRDVPMETEDAPAT